MEEEERRPFPDPEHDLSLRKPRTLGGAIYLAVLAVAIAGLVIAASGAWETGVLALGGAMVVAAAARLVLPDREAGMLHVRRKFVDVAILLGFGCGLMALAELVPTGVGP